MKQRTATRKGNARSGVRISISYDAREGSPLLKALSTQLESGNASAARLLYLERETLERVWSDFLKMYQGRDLRSVLSSCLTQTQELLLLAFLHSLSLTDFPFPIEPRDYDLEIQET